MHQVNFHRCNTNVSETNKLEISVAATAMTILKAKLDINVILIIVCGLTSVLNNQIKISKEEV